MKKPVESTLLIWEEVPDATKLYVIPNNVAEPRRELLDQAHGHLINDSNWDSNPGLLFLSSALMDASEDSAPGEFQPYLVSSTEASRLTPGMTPIKGAHITHVVFSGFLL